MHTCVCTAAELAVAFDSTDPTYVRRFMSTANPVAPCDFVVFGGTGDLAVRKLLPALYLRDRDGQLAAETRIIAASRAGLDISRYRDSVRGELARVVAHDAIDKQTLDPFLA